MNDALINVIIQCDSMLTPNVFTKLSETSVGPSSTGVSPPIESSETISPDPSQRGGRKGKGKVKGKLNNTTVSKGKAKKKKRSTKENHDKEAIVALSVR